MSKKIWELKVETRDFLGKSLVQKIDTDAWQFDERGNLTSFGKPVDQDGLEGLCFPFETGLFIPAHNIISMKVVLKHKPERPVILSPDSNGGGIVTPN